MFRKIIKGLKDVWCGTLEFDTEPKKGSFNPVTSGGVYEAINGAGGAKEIVYFEVDLSDPPSGLYNDIGTALSNDKEPVIKIDGDVYFYTSTGTDKYIFVGGYNTEVVNYKTVTVSDDDSVVVETVDTIEGMVFPLYYHSNDGGFTVADKTGHALTKTEIVDAYRAGQIFMFSSYPASNTQAHWGYCCDINIESDNTGYAEFLILDAFGGDVYSWEKYRIRLLSNTEFVTLEGPNTSYTTGGSGSFADAATTVSVSDSQDFSSTQKAQGRSNIGAASASDVTALQSQVSSLSDVSAYSVKGEATVAQLNAGPSGIQAGWAYQLKDSGTLTDGSLAVVAGDTVAWDGTKWFPLVKSDYYATKTYAQNVAHSIAPEFDPTKPNDAGGYAYYKDEIVVYNGATYKFKMNHSSGAWNPAEVERYVAGESLELFLVTNSPEYLYAVTDKDGVFLFGVKKDGSVEWQKGVPQKIQEAINGVLNTISEDVAIINAAMLLKVDKEAGKSLIDSVFAAAQSSENNPEYVYALCDNGKYLLFSIGNDGKFTFHTKLEPKDGIVWNAVALTELEVALRENGFMEGNGDWSEKKSLNIPKPKMAIIDFSNISAMPTTKTDNLHGVMRFWDMDGNFFKKNVIMNAQGNSSLNYEKKNVAIDICNDGWVGDDTFKLKIGEWVEQDSFHLKAYFTDFFRGVAVAGYEIYDQILQDRGPEIDRTWKMANVNLSAQSSYAALGVGQNTDVSNKCDYGARCFPDGFPCAVYLNGKFYGLFQFQLKKHRDNYMMNKNNPAHIHLDGVLGSTTFFGGVVDWTAFEIRNPKNLWTALGTKYDGDSPTEIVGSEDAEAWISDGVMPSGTAVTAKIATQLRNTAAVKQSILDFSLVEESIHAASTTDEKKEIFNSVYNLDNLIDYQIFGDVTHNVDGFNKNWQWTTWDGSHWFVNAYDLDMVFGGDSAGQFIYKPSTERILQNRSNPCYYAVQLYGSEVEARYKELRDKGIVSVKNFVNLVADITKKFGIDFYKKEYEKWTNVPCNRNIVVSDKWELVMDGSGNPVITESSSGFYNERTTYSVGDTCVYNRVSSASWFYTFRCVQPSTGVAPAILGFVDSMWRLEKWVKETISNMDNVYNY